jgi:acyl homoserine lactone synthase
MLRVVQTHNAAENESLLREMFRLRAHVFGEKLKWDVTVTDGMERDQYDDCGPVYIIYTDRKSLVLGCMRLLPTTGPTLLSDIFADTIPDAAELSAPGIWECTRFCLHPRIACAENRAEAMHVSRIMIGRLGEIAINSGIHSIVGNFDAAMLRIYRRIGCKVEVLGRTLRFGAPVYLGLFPVSEEIIQRVLSLAPALPTSVAHWSHVPGDRRAADASLVAAQ